MVLRAAAGLIILALLLSGCAGSPFLSSRQGLADWKPLPCDPSKQHERNLLTEKEPSPAGDLSGLAKRLGDAVGDPVLTKAPTVNADGRSEWRTTHGTIRTRHAIDVTTLLEYEARRAWPGLDPAAGRAALEQFADALGLPGERLVNYTSKDAGQFQGKIHQALEGRAVGTMATEVTYVERGQVEGAYVRMMLRPFWVLPSGDRSVDEQKVLAIAQTFMRCQMDLAERTQARGYEHRYTGLVFDWLPIHNKTVAYVVVSRFHNPMGGSCPSEKSEGTIYVDAWTGSVLTWDWNRCTKTASVLR